MSGLPLVEKRSFASYSGAVMQMSSKHLRDMYRLFASIESEKEAALLLEDILTPQELASVAERWQLIQELSKGTPQRTIAEKLGVSISKITRGSRMLQYGSGGFSHFLKKLGKRE
jgi:TrpR family trp operon transcriptional repressor